MVLNRKNYQTVNFINDLESRTYWATSTEIHRAKNNSTQRLGKASNKPTGRQMSTKKLPNKKDFSKNKSKHWISN